MKQQFTLLCLTIFSMTCYCQQNFKQELRPNIGLQFRGSMNLNDTLSKTDFSLFVLQIGTEYDLLKNSKIVSFSPNVACKLGFFFFLTTGIKSGITIGINDKLKTGFPIGFQFTMDYDINLNMYNGNRIGYLGWCPEGSLLINVSKETMLKLSYGLTLIPNNNKNHIHNITIGFTGLKDF